MKKSTTISILIGTAALLLTVSACDLGDKATEQFKDSPRIPGVNYSPMKVIAMADGFSNMGTKCDGYGNRVYVVFHGDGSYSAGWPIAYTSLAPQDPCRSDFSSIPVPQ